jgi:hypothetical protein
MIYDSFNGRANGAQGYPLLTVNNEFIYTAGNPSAWLAKPSRMDIERMKALYPKRHVPMFAGWPIHSRSTGAKITNDTESKQGWVEVKMPGVTTTSVMALPTDFPKSVNDPKAVEIANKYSASHRSWFSEHDVECE